MRTSIICCLLMLKSWIGIAQNGKVDSLLVHMIIPTQPVNRYVRGCDANSRVVNLTAKMEMPTAKLPSPVERKGAVTYKIKNEKYEFTYFKEAGSDLYVWMNENDKHCFNFDKEVKYHFTKYFASNESFEVYGKMHWSNYSRNFRIIFYSSSKEVLLDFDDEILRK